MNQPQMKNPGSELRLLVASLLSVVVMLVWWNFFAPKPPAVPQVKKGAQSASTPTAQNPTAGGTAGSTGNAALPSGKATGIAAVQAASIPAKGETQERTIVVESDLYRVEFSNRGAVVKSWQLKKYRDDAKLPRVLDVVHPDAAQQTGGWPFALSLDDPEQEAAANSGLYQISSSASLVNAPSDVEFSWSDGHLEVSKKMHFDRNYVVRVETSVKLNGAPIKAGLAWLGGFGDLTVANPAPIETVSIVYSESGKVSTIPAKKLEGPEKWARGFWQSGRDWDGIEDRYFAAAFLPANGNAPGTLEARYWKVSRTVKVEDKDTEEPVPQIATAAPVQAQAQALRVYVGPKDYDELKKLNPPLHSLVNFGWFEVISDPLFHALKWLHGYVSNWGWAIVVLTLIINMLLFPLKYTGYKMSLKMQRVAPEIKQIQEKYKKYSMRDPRKAEMNKEVMAVYAREGINPVGGCVPQLLQMPIWFGLYRALQGTIEIRHGHWLWITDLSAKDPYYILPVLMGLSMYFASKMTPMTATDPQQQAMMKIMPLMMAGMFVVIPYPSGLAVYILTSGLVGIAQQWWLNQRHPLPTAPAKPARGKNKKA